MSWFKSKPIEPPRPGEYVRQSKNGDTQTYRIDHPGEAFTLREGVLHAIRDDWRLLQRVASYDENDLVDFTFYHKVTVPAGLVIQVAKEAGVDISSLLRLSEQASDTSTRSDA